MKCKTLHKKLIFFVEGDLTEMEEKMVAAHLDHCADCAAFAEDLKKTLGVLQAEKSPEVNPFFYTRLKARMENNEAIAKQRARVPAWNRILQPAFFSLLLLAGIYVGTKIGQPARFEMPAEAYTQTELVPFLNEMKAEPIETFLMESNDGNTK